MKKNIMARLRGKAGETIAETLIATLIAALALTMLAGAVASAAKIVTKSKSTMDTYRTEEVDQMKTDWSGAMDALDSVEITS